MIKRKTSLVTRNIWPRNSLTSIQLCSRKVLPLNICPMSTKLFLVTFHSLVNPMRDCFWRTLSSAGTAGGMATAWVLHLHQELWRHLPSRGSPVLLARHHHRGHQGPVRGLGSCSQHEGGGQGHPYRWVEHQHQQWVRSVQGEDEVDSARLNDIWRSSSSQPGHQVRGHCLGQDVLPHHNCRPHLFSQVSDNRQN